MLRNGIAGVIPARAELFLEVLDYLAEREACIGDVYDVNDITMPGLETFYASGDMAGISLIDDVS